MPKPASAPAAQTPESQRVSVSLEEAAEDPAIAHALATFDGDEDDDSGLLTDKSGPMGEPKAKERAEKNKPDYVDPRTAGDEGEGEVGADDDEPPVTKEGGDEDDDAPDPDLPPDEGEGEEPEGGEPKAPDARLKTEGDVRKAYREMHRKMGEMSTELGALRGQVAASATAPADSIESMIHGGRYEEAMAKVREIHSAVEKQRTQDLVEQTMNPRKFHDKLERERREKEEFMTEAEQAEARELESKWKPVLGDEGYELIQTGVKQIETALKTYVPRTIKGRVVQVPQLGTRDLHFFAALGLQEFLAKKALGKPGTGTKERGRMASPETMADRQQDPPRRKQKSDEDDSGRTKRSLYDPAAPPIL